MRLRTPNNRRRIHGGADYGVEDRAQQLDPLNGDCRARRGGLSRPPVIGDLLTPADSEYYISIVYIAILTRVAIVGG